MGWDEVVKLQICEIKKNQQIIFFNINPRDKDDWGDFENVKFWTK